MKQNKQHLVKAAFALLIGALSFSANAQLRSEAWKTEKKVKVLFGLSQIFLASGFNIEGDYIHNRFIFDYSHGQFLDFKGATVPTELKKQGIAVYMPWTTGFGVGYRLREWLNIRVEPKWHRFECYYQDEPQTKSDPIVSFNTVTVGLGLYGSWQPFKKKDNSLKGFTVAPSFRWWPTLYSTLAGGKYSYFNERTGANEQIKTLGPGIGFTSFIVNVSIGYTFSLKKKR